MSDEEGLARMITGTGRGAHLNLKHAEKAGVLVQKIPTMIDNLIDKTFAWEDESNTPFLYDVDQKNMYNLLRKENEMIFGSKSVPRKISSFNRRTPKWERGWFHDSDAHTQAFDTTLVLWTVQQLLQGEPADDGGTTQLLGGFQG
uniref:Uncharacterized protein n=1 Tax=Aegilops tauschii TaxID=37682 RepID=R7WCQ9_AEGTA